MSTKVSLDEQLFRALQEAGEVQVEDTRGVPIVLMTVAARQQLRSIAYDDSDLTDEEMMAMGADQLNDPQGWGAPGMDIYDTMEGIDSSANGNP